MTTKPIVIGVHPGYKRKQDVEIQTRLVRPDIQVVYSLEDLAEKTEQEYLKKLYYDMKGDIK